jgi:acetoin utilization deacetylase AcuC-like enzyme
VQEGGYLCDALGDNLTAFLTGFGNQMKGPT